MQHPQSTPNTSRRRSGKQPAPKGILPLLLVFGVFLVLMVIIAPQLSKPTVATPQVTETEAGATTYALHITEVMSSNSTSFPDERGAFPDWVEFTNESDQPLPLDQFGFSDRDDKIIFTFPAETLPPHERIIVFCSNESRSEAGKTLHANFKISSAGETLVLYGPNGAIYERVDVPPLNSDLVYAKTLDGWVVSDMPTPGFANTQEGYAAFRASTYLETGALVLNEMVASNHSTIADEDGDYSDWIELYNRSDKEIDLTNLSLSDNPEKLNKWRFPEGAVIGPKGYYLVFASGKDRPGGDGKNPHANFGLSAEKEIVLLSDIHGQLVDQTSYELLPPDQSWGRKEGGDMTWQVFTNPTPNLPNNAASSLQMDYDMIVRNPARVAIMEVMSSNTATLLPDDTKTADWIELYNYGKEAYDLSGCGLSDRINHPRKWRFPAGTIVQPGEYITVVCDGLGQAKAGLLHTNFNLSSMGETVCLSDPSGKILDKLVVPKLLPDLTYGRTLSQSGLFYFAQASPGAPNTGNFNGFAEDPAFATRGGMYERPITVEINVPEGGEVRYTTDCTEPTSESAVYEGPIEVASTTIIRARGYMPGLSPSQVITQTYFISVYATLPVISLVTEPDHVTNVATGMLAKGPLEGNESVWRRPWFEPVRNDKDGYFAHTEYATYGKKLHYDGFMEMYLEDGLQALSTGMEFHVMGQFSLDMPQKSFSLNAKKRFGTGYFEYPVFGDRPFERYKAFALRNGGQDGLYTRVLDGLQARVVAETEGSTVLSQAWQPVIVFLNGEYWGHYNLRERINRHFVAQHEGWSDPDAMDIIEGDGDSSADANWGSIKEYRSLLKYVEDNDLRDDAVMAKVADQVDIDNMFDYFIFEMYFGNTDPGNIRFYKKHGEGNKWKFIFYDVDWGLYDSTAGGPAYVLNPKGMGNYRINNLLIRSVLQNDAMRDKFLRRLGQLFQTEFLPERLLERFDEMIAQIAPEMPMHHDRWAEEMPKEVSLDVPKNGPGAFSYWQQRNKRARNVIRWRPYVFWGMVQDHFQLSDEVMLDYFGPRPPTDNPEILKKLQQQQPK